MYVVACDGIEENGLCELLWIHLGLTIANDVL